MWESAKARKLTRLAAFQCLRSMEGALKTLGASLEDYKLPDGMTIRPVVANEVRLALPSGGTALVNTESETVAQEAPDGFKWEDFHMPVSIIDQVGEGGSPYQSKALDMQYTHSQINKQICHHACHGFVLAVADNAM
jgi:hypothetical protein